MHHYDFHIGDYMKATAHLSNEEDLCYRRLLDMYYDTEAPIPLETDWVSRRLRIGTEVVIAVLSDFFIKREDGWHSLRCDEEISHYKAICEKNREVGKLGGRPKKTQTVANGNRLETQTVSVGNRLETESNPNQEPVTSNQIKEGEASPPSDFAEEIFTIGKKLLGAKAGGLLGQARKRVGDQKVVEVLAGMSMMKPQVSEPMSYFVAATTPKSRGLVL